MTVVWTPLEMDWGWNIPIGISSLSLCVIAIMAISAQIAPKLCARKEMIR